MKQDESDLVLTGKLVDHLFCLAKVLQGARPEDVINFNNKAAKQVLDAFASDPLPSTLFMFKSEESWTISQSIEGATDGLSTIVVIKDSGIINESTSLESQLQVVNLPSIGSSFETLRSLVSLGIGSFFDAITFENNTDFVASTRKKINELALSLRNIEQSIQTPDLSITFHPILKEAIDRGANLQNYTEILGEETILDPSFLNSLQNIVNDWIISIQAITKMDRDIPQDSAFEEINFWTSMENSLTSIQDQINSVGVQLTLEVLKYAKRYHATVSFLSDTGIKDAMKITTDYNKLMKDFPLHELLAAESFSKIEEAVILIMNHLKRIRLTAYPISRVLLFVEAISNDLDSKVRPMLKNLMSLEFTEFEAQVELVNSLFLTWDRQVKEFTNIARELLRKRGEKFIFVKINSKTTLLEDRLKEIQQFRRGHQDFVNTLQDTPLLESDLTFAYDAVRLVDAFDNDKHWSSARNLYDGRIEEIENNIVDELRNSLDSATNSNELFEIFENHKNLLERPRIRGAIQEYQSHLLSIVRSEIDKLQHNFSSNAGINKISELHDYPRSAYILLWGKQTQAKLEFLMKRLESVFGQGWSSYSEGQKIYQECLVFKKKLDLTSRFDKWLESAKEYSLNGNVLKLIKEKDVSLQLNFDESLMSFFKEVRALSWQGFQLPHQVILNSRKVRKVYMHAIVLQESLVTLGQLSSSLESLDDLEILLLDLKNELYEAITAALTIQWDDLVRAYDLQNVDVKVEEHEKLATVIKIEKLTSELFKKINELSVHHDEIRNIFDELVAVKFNQKSVALLIEKLQSVVKEVAKSSFSQVDVFLEKLNERLAQKLVQVFSNLKLDTESFNHHIVVDDFLVVEPPLEQTKAIFYGQMQEYTSLLLQQHKLIESSLDTTDENYAIDFQDHMDTILAKFKLSVDKVESDYVDSCEFVEKWQLSNLLWELDSDDRYATGTIDFWLEMLDEVKKRKTMFETAESVISFGIFEINFQDAKEVMYSKFSSWNRNLIQKFAEFMNDAVKLLHISITKGRKTLESMEVSLTSVSETVELISNLEIQKKFVEGFDERISRLREGEIILFKAKHKFSDDHYFVDQLDTDYASLIEIIELRSNAIQKNVDIITKNIENEAQRIENSIIEIQNSWSQSKPGSDLSPDDAIIVINSFESRISVVEKRKFLLNQAATLLVLPISVNKDLSSTSEELNDLKSVWCSVQGLWQSLEDLKKTPWGSLKPRQLRKQLEELLQNTRSMPSKVRQHRPYQKFLKLVMDLSNSQKIILTLREDFIKERHLKDLFNQLGKKYSTNLTIGDFWDLNLFLHEVIVNQLITKAESERVIEESLTSIQNHWADQRFEFFEFHNRRLVSNFEQLIELSSTDLSSLTSMKNSSSFKTFETDIDQWTNKLYTLYTIIDHWVDVQRQWMDLDGIFDSKSGIKKLLTAEASRFQGISVEFISTTKRVFKNPLVIEATSLSELANIMNRLSESLSKISKALGDFLEKQRELYPRFYFIGNDDLLAILGSDDVQSIGKHFKKMFPGVSSLTLDKNSNSISSVLSESGEEVKLTNPVQLDKYERIDEWIAQLDYQIKFTVATLLNECLEAFQSYNLLELLDRFPEQVVLLTLQISWTKATESSIISQDFDSQLSEIDNRLRFLSSTSDHHDKRFESLIIECFHHKDVLLELRAHAVHSVSSFYWSSRQRFYHDASLKDVLASVKVKQLTMSFNYGFEYLGSMDRLVYTPLLSKCFMAMSGALEQGLGGSPFGPAGTGKTESIKAMGSLLGKMVVVFNCDESFDFQAVGRLLSGICQVGGWGCFDEFNRLDKNILSAVSSQLGQIELGLKGKSKSIELLDRRIPLIEGTGIFVTMNPGYSGRSELPENLKKLFRSFSMVKPDSMLICKVLLAAGGFTEAEILSEKVVEFFDLIRNDVSPQKHYDFGLRSIKSTLENAILILKEIADHQKNQTGVIVKSLKEMILPRLTNDDSIIFEKTMTKVFPNCIEVDNSQELKEKLKVTAEKNGFVATELWLQKALQLAKIQETQQGVIIAGKSGSGKSSIISNVIETLGQTEINIDPKVLKKHELFGQFYPSTRQWNDGLFTALIRRINEDLRGDLQKKFCFVFDGDIDPIWVESLNSVLDDNKTLTLPNGERLKIPSNIRFIFETDSLETATPATISRCGMIITEVNMLKTSDIIRNKLYSLKQKFTSRTHELPQTSDILSDYMKVLSELLDISLIDYCLDVSLHSVSHISKVSRNSLLTSLFIFLQSSLENFLSEGGFLDALTDYVTNSFYLGLYYGFAGSANNIERAKFCEFVKRRIDGFPETLDCYLSIEGQLKTYLPLSVSLDSHAINNPNTVVETIDTLRHEDLIHSVLSQKSSLILCGPPGAGKTMSLYAVLQSSPEIDLVNLNFSKETDPKTVLRALEQCCEYKKSPEGFVLRPKTVGKRVVMFADEINLPQPDEYGTQKVITFLRQMIEKRGFWKVSGQQWVSIQDIQFVGACNPSVDAGRYELSERFLSHIPVIMVDYPGLNSLSQIYDAFVSSVLKMVPHLRGYTNELTSSMIEIYTKSLETFTVQSQPHYIYTPRELTRWVRGIHSALSSNTEESIELDELIRLFVHEADRLFSDRLVNEREKELSFSLISKVVIKNFPNLNAEKVFKRPLLYSNWLSLNYADVSLESIGQFIKDKFDVFTQEMLDVDFVFYDSLIQEVLNIDRVLRQSGGHMMLIGPSGSGKRTLTKFVAWMNSLKVKQLNISRNYTIHEFDQTLKEILKSCGIDGEKLVFLLDTSIIQQTAFFERINSLLANGQINDLFDPDEYQMILRSLREQCQMNNVLVDSDEEVENILVSNISQNLHVVFTMTGIESRDGPQIISSPALFNRCVIDWIGDMSDKTMVQIAKKKLQMSPVGAIEPVIESLVFIHKSSGVAQPPAKYFQLIDNFISVFESKQSELEKSQRHTNNGVIKLKETVLTVSQQRKELAQKQVYLKQREIQAHEMLDKILEDQNLSERKKEASVSIKQTLAKQDIIIEKRKDEVLRDLELAEPAVLEARAGVQNIKKQHLTELRSMSSPPATIQLILESVCVLLGYEVASWRDVQSIIRKDDFIFNIVNFDCQEQVTTEVRKYMEAEYLSRPEYNQQAAYRASQACGPLLQWVEAQVKYAIVLGKIGPLQDEIQQLEQESQQTRARLSAADDMIEELEESIQKFKDGYTEVIRETENIKLEIKEVESRTERSMTIVQNLESEKNRWISNIKAFKDQNINLVPQCLLTASFLTYSGTYAHRSRAQQYESWSRFMRDSGLEFTDINVVDHLNTPVNLVQWERCGLPNDDLFFENVTILEKIHAPKVQYLIDGVGDLLEILTKKFDRKLSFTSFLNKSFIHDLQNALRFGGVLVVQDAEYFDPILAPLLSGDLQKVGGRTLIKIGDKDVDCSPDFKLILYTKDHTAKVPKFVEATTTVIDFSITETSLEMKSLDMIIKSERPDVYQKKIDYIKLSNDYKYELGNLENSLLESLNTEGNLLDNLEVLKNLEDIKLKATDVNEKIKETAGVMNQISELSTKYEPFAKSASMLFSLLSRFSELHHFYQISLNEFISWIQTVLDTGDKKNSSSRVFFLLEELYKEVFSRVSPTLTVRDKNIALIAFSVLLFSERENESFARFILKLLESEVLEFDEKVSSIQDALAELSVTISSMTIQGALSSGDSLKLLEELRAKNVDVSSAISLLKYVLSKDLNQCFDASLATLSSTLKNTKSQDLNSVIVNNTSNRPIMLSSTSSFDPSYKILDISASLKKDLKVVALGSSESAKMSIREISRASKQGSWVMIQNIHTSPEWLESFEKTFSSYQSHPDFRLFLTCDSRSDVPISLLRDSIVLMFENNPGIKSVFKESFKADDTGFPIEKQYIYYLLTWFHSILQERERYVPKGFTKSYDFNDSDYQSALFFIDELVKMLYGTKEHVAPSEIDWAYISLVISEIIYGGKVDVFSDLEYLVKLGRHVFTADSFEVDFNLVECSDPSIKVVPPEGRSIEDYAKWIEELPEIEPVSWLGLDDDSEFDVKKREFQGVLEKAKDLVSSVSPL